MANLNSKIVIETELRSCIVKDKKALFHKWCDNSKILNPSPMVGGHNGGVLKYTVAIIEYENGVVTECYPYEVKFIDRKFKEYCFSE